MKFKLFLAPEHTHQHSMQKHWREIEEKDGLSLEMHQTIDMK